MIESIRTKDQPDTPPKGTKKPRKQGKKPKRAASVPVVAETPLETQETPKKEAAAYGLKDYTMYEADSNVRNEPDLRIEMSKLIDALGQVLDHMPLP